jgi:DNA polymerase I-like protein with 3'-5' exonuclease and polymerase domains
LGGPATGVLKLAIGKLHKTAPENCQMPLTVHSSGLLEVFQTQIRAVTDLVPEVMELSPPRFTIPRTVNVRVGDNLGAYKNRHP